MGFTGAGQFERVIRGSTSFTTGALGLGREQTGTATIDFTRDDEGLLLALRTGPSSANTYYPLFDGLGSVAGLSDSTGALSADYRYEPFGKRLSCTGTACSLQNPYQWLGGLGVYLDSATGLYKMGTRYYDPALGRFTQVDPVEGGSANRYDYANQDPVNLVDPRGEDTWGKDCLSGRDFYCGPFSKMIEQRRNTKKMVAGGLIFLGGAGVTGHSALAMRICLRQLTGLATYWCWAHLKGMALGDLMMFGGGAIFCEGYNRNRSCLKRERRRPALKA